jgi:hypothetical protein
VVTERTQPADPSADPTTALRVEETAMHSATVAKLQKKRLVFIGLLLVAIVFLSLVLIFGSHGEGPR